MNRFLGELYIPTYNKLKHYYFHDVLISFVKFFFAQKQAANFNERKEVIQNLISTN